MKLTKTVVDRIITPNTDQVIYRDDQLRGFALRITRNGIKSFIVEKRTNKKLTRITLGRYGDLTVEQARKEAQKVLGKLATGIDPAAEKQLIKLQNITLENVFEDYLKTRKSLKVKTRDDYEKLLNLAFAEWKTKRLTEITKDKVESHHAFLGNQHGPAYANYAMRMLRALFYFAMDKYQDDKNQSVVVENPVKRLSKTHAWFPVKARKTYIKQHQLPAWYKAVLASENEIICDYLITVLFTGLRKNEAAQLSKNNIDLKDKTLVILDPKNHEQHVLPLPDHLCLLLKKRIAASPNEYVFPGTGKNGYLVEPKKQIKKICDAAELTFTIHDLRRTFITIAERLDIPAYALKRLLNHKIRKSDVTAGYIITDVERLRKPMQQISDYILSKCLEEVQEQFQNSMLHTQESTVVSI
jgi:integrase